MSKKGMENQFLVTGDKKETALNISYSCGHFTQDMTVLDLTGQTAMRVGGKLQTYTDLTSHREEQWALVVDGLRYLVHHVCIWSHSFHISFFQPDKHPPPSRK